MKTEHIYISQIPAIIWGAVSDQVYLYIHGQGGNKEEGRVLADIACCRGWQVLSIDLPGHGEQKNSTAAFDPWHVVPELSAVMGYAQDHWKTISLFANSIGAWFSMLSFRELPIQKSLFLSPILDMPQLIKDMMLWAGVSEEQLKRERMIPTAFGQTLSWEYREYALQHPIRQWNCPTHILYAGKDHLTSRDTVSQFARIHHCDLEIYEDGEHWFHTKPQLAVLSDWIKKCIPFY